MAQEVYVVIEFDRETDEFREVEGVFQSKEEAEDFAKEYSARYLRYSYGCYEGTYDADEVDAVLAEKDAEIRRLKRALYKACFNWAHFAVAFFAEYRTKEKWRKMENKCRAKAEEYK